MTGPLGRLTKALAVLLLVLAPASLRADPEDINAAARGVVRIVIVEINGEALSPISHGTGFAVGPERIVTNAHVIAEAREDEEPGITQRQPQSHRQAGLPAIQWSFDRRRRASCAGH